MHMGSGSAWPQFSSWHVTGLVAAVAVVGAAILAFAWTKMTTRQHAAASTAWLLATLLLASDVQTRSMSSYRCHMIEHIVVVLVIAPLVSSTIRWPMSRTWASVAFLALTILVPVYHLTDLGGYVMEHAGGHAAELASFFIIGVWFWIPVYGARPVMTDFQRLVYVALAVPIIVTTGLVLWSSTASSLHTLDMNMSMIDLTDIHDGGVVMMALGGVAMAAHVVWISLSSARHRFVARQPLGRRYAETA